jgi:membrane peptidoglycan carboxypeptidase
LQNAMVAEGIADTGVVMTPHLMASIRTNAQDQLVQSYNTKAYKNATSSTAAQSVNKLMQGVVATPKGTAYGVGFPPQDKVAAKTGTAQVGTPVTTTVDWMVGFAPATNPTVAVAVVVPEQSLTHYGATIAGPIMLRMIETTLTLQAQQAQRSAASTTTTTTTPHATTPTYRAPVTPGRGTTPTTAVVPSTTVAPTTTTTTVPPTTTAPTTPVGTPTATPPTTRTGTGGTATGGTG